MQTRVPTLAKELCCIQVVQDREGAVATHRAVGRHMEPSSTVLTGVLPVPGVATHLKGRKQERHV